MPRAVVALLDLAPFLAPSPEPDKHCSGEVARWRTKVLLSVETCTALRCASDGEPSGTRLGEYPGTVPARPHSPTSSVRTLRRDSVSSKRGHTPPRAGAVCREAGFGRARGRH